MMTRDDDTIHISNFVHIYQRGFTFIHIYQWRFICLRFVHIYQWLFTCFQRVHVFFSFFFLESILLWSLRL